MIRPAALAATYFAITAVVVSPLVDFRHLGSASYEGDARLVIWALAWDARALLTATPFFDANIYFPEPQALSYAEHHAGIGLFGVPVYAATRNPVLTYWMLWLLAFPLNAMAMHVLAWRVTRDHVAAFAAGCIYAFCFFRMHHGHGHLQLLWTWMLPLVPLALDRWLERPTVARAATVTALVVLAALTSWYLAVFVALLALISFACVMRGHRLGAAHLWQGLAAAGVGLAAIAWFARPYVRLTSGPLEEAIANAADPASYLVPPLNTWLGQMVERYTSIEPRWIWGEQTLYVGVAVLALCAMGAAHVLSGGIADGRDRRLAAAVSITGGVALALSFGPTTTGLSPFDLVSHLPGLALLRAPARFALLVMLAAALLAALGASWLRSRYARPGLLGTASLPAPLLAPLLLLFFFESFVVGFPAGKPQPVPVPAVYHALSGRAPGAVLSLPTYRGTPEAFRESDYLLFSTAHWLPIVNGFGRQEPPAHAARMAVLAGFPSPDSIALLRELKIRYVVLHTRRASELAQRAADARTRVAVRLLYSADGDVLFEVH